MNAAGQLAEHLEKGLLRQTRDVVARHALRSSGELGEVLLSKLGTMPISCRAHDKVLEEVAALLLGRQSHLDEVAESTQGSLVDRVGAVRGPDEEDALLAAVETIHPCEQGVDNALVVLRHTGTAIPLPQERVHLVEEDDGRAPLPRQRLKRRDAFLRVAVELRHHVRGPHVEEGGSGFVGVDAAELSGGSLGEHRLATPRRPVEQHAPALAADAAEQLRRPQGRPQHALSQHALGVLHADDVAEGGPS
mmetsp:Transcript_44144/g.127410  ORF Transcript_44144/g.127410 Transcript_44144/m.127410 type:complete len:249 (+) Transcript_44144:293-1039(+)